MSLWAVIPVKPLRRGKSRLISVLSECERTLLNKRMLISTLRNIREVPQIDGFVVISCDPEVLAIASENGARTVKESRFTDINRALRYATIAVRSYNASEILILPADLPLINREDIIQLINRSGNPPEIIISSDRRQDGTNALMINPIGILEYDFGVMSFRKHIKQAEKKGLRIDIYNSDKLSYDLDLPEDLELLKAKGLMIL